MNNLSSDQIQKLLQMASTKSPEEILKKIMNDKEMTEKIMKSKTAQDIMHKFQNKK